MSTALKIPKDAFVSALKSRLARAEVAQAARIAHNKAYNKAMNEYCMKELKDALKNKSELDVMQHYSGDIQITLRNRKKFEYPQFDDHEGELSSWAIDEITRAIKLIEMSESEYVPASLHKNVASYI